MKVNTIGSGKIKSNSRFKKTKKSNKDIYLCIGQNIRSLRTQYKITLEELAESANINASFMGNIERGQRKPTLYTLEKVANALNVNLADIIGYEVISNPLSESELLEINIRRTIKNKSIIQKKKIYNIIKYI